MESGFSFCGVDIKDIGLEYVPELENTYVYSPAEKNVHEETYDGHTGGYYYGAWSQPKEFTLRCLFEDKQIDMGVMANVYELFRVGRVGKLIFNRRPWCYYNARVTSPVESDFSNYLNGLVTIHMKAYFPFARSDTMFNLRTDDHYVEIMNNTGLFNKAEMVPETSFEFNEDTSFILANPGTEAAPVAISIQGNAKNVTITNQNNNQTCSFVNITDDLGEIVCDTLSGKIIRIKDGETLPAYLYHYGGFISLDPSFPVKREVYIETVNGTTVKVSNILYNDYAGQYIFIKNKWYKIASMQDKHTLILETPAESSAAQQTIISRMNELSISFEEPANLHVRFEYKPTFA